MQVVAAPPVAVSHSDRLRLTQVENATVVAVLAAMVIFPLLEAGGRAALGRGVPGAIVLVQHLTLWVAMLGAALAARRNRLLALATLHLVPERWQLAARTFAAGVGAAIVATLAWVSVDLVTVQREAGQVVAFGVPASAVVGVMPVAFAIVALRLVLHADHSLRSRLIAALGLLLPLIFLWLPTTMEGPAAALGMFVIAVALALGMPIFCAIAGVTALLLRLDATPVNAIPLEAYRLTTSEILPAIPLFAFAGYILADGGASRRLTALLTAAVGWLPGGLAFVTAGALALFTPLTGASGVTIVSMGGLLLPVLVQARYPLSTSLGLVTVSGSIGLLFFPSLPVFLYAFYANVPFDRLFVGGLLPGVLLVVAVAAWGGARGWQCGAEPNPFRLREIRRTVLAAKWDLLLPVIVLGALLTGTTTLVEAAALAVLCAALVETQVYRSSTIGDVCRAALECATLIGGFLIILCVALGFTSYLTLLEVPVRLVAWVRSHVDSPIVFLLALNVLLILVGALMDIYSAIVVFVPLIVPLGVAYGIDPVHLGVIFLANMELGYLMPPMGENLFLSSYRFGRPLADVYRATLPYTVMLLIVVLIITYAPWLTLWLIGVLEARALL